MEYNRAIKALKNINAIVTAYNKGTLIITTEHNGYRGNVTGLDVIMAIIRINIVDGLYDPLESKERYLYD